MGQIQIEVSPFPPDDTGVTLSVLDAWIERAYLNSEAGRMAG